MTVRWSLDATEDRRRIFDFISVEDPFAAKRMDELFSAAAERLISFPLMGRQGRLDGTREVVPHKRYRLIYEADGNDVLILALVHTARLWPPETL